MVFKRLNIDALKRQAPIPDHVKGSGDGQHAKNPTAKNPTAKNPTAKNPTAKNPTDFLDARTRAEKIAESAAMGRRRDPRVPKEFGGPKSLEPTRYGDWEKAGRCIDF